MKQKNKMTTSLKYLSHYSQDIQQQVHTLIVENKLKTYLLNHFPKPHSVTTDKALRQYCLTYKQQYLKQSAPLSQVKYDDKIHIINNALGLHTYVSRVQGSKLKSKNEIRIGSVFKKAPEALLQMILVHELAHIKEKQHNKAFYKLCEHMLPNYHQLELMTRIYLTELENNGNIYS
jgi:predicted metal-dependent hydrolase|tara:strand:- start:475 stop:1002 length:528 start_codon:yes stop_codon:yes gene_type:complete